MSADAYHLTASHPEGLGAKLVMLNALEDAEMKPEDVDYINVHASGHIIEQIELVKEILANGYAYESEGSIYFDVAKYNKDHHYGKLSGRNLDDVLNTTRDLDGQSEKHNPADFALWKNAQPEHIMRWPSPWNQLQSR